MQRILSLFDTRPSHGAGFGLGTLALLMALGLGPAGCKKKNQGGTQDPDLANQDPKGQKAGKSAASGEDQGPPVVTQLPDPPEILESPHQYWRGDYEQMVKELETKLTQWQAPNQARAFGLAHAWIALAHAEQLPENAQSHVESALETAQAIQDPQVEALAHIAHALSLVAMADAKTAQPLIENIQVDNEHIEHLLHIARAKTAINLAFDEQDRLAHPEQLDHAAKDYQEITPKDEQDKSAVMGHVYEGLAAIAKFRGNNAELCVQAKKAKQAYEDGKASDFLRSGPERMLSTAGCS